MSQKNDPLLVVAAQLHDVSTRLVALKIRFSILEERLEHELGERDAILRMLKKKAREHGKKSIIGAALLELSQLIEQEEHLK